MLSEGQKIAGKVMVSVGDAVLRNSIKAALSSYIPGTEIITGTYEGDIKEICVTVTDQAQCKKSKQAIIYLAHSQLKSTDFSEKDLFTIPLRLGTLIERVQHYIRIYAKKGVEEVVIIGSYKFIQEEDTLMEINESGLDRLTEKECHILYILQGRKGETVERKALLRAVWGYVDGVETHTLETHIYRLRQKIETNPGKPEILLTAGTGYRLSG